MEAMKLQKKVKASAMLDPKILVPAIKSAFVKLDPRLMIKSPVMFVVEVVAALTTVIFLRDVVTGGAGNISVSYAGKTYYVCCSGCKELFDAEPEKVIAEYHARIAAKK